MFVVFDWTTYGIASATCLGVVITFAVIELGVVVSTSLKTSWTTYTVDFGIVFMPLLDGSGVIQLMMEKRFVLMMHGTVLAYIDSRAILHELRIEVDVSLIVVSNCIITMCCDDSLRIVSFDLMAFLDTIKDSTLATMSTYLHIDWGFLRTNDESLHIGFWKAIEHTLEAKFVDLDVVSMGT